MKYSIILVILFSISLTNCGNANSKKSLDNSSPKEITVNKMDFKTLITSINKKVVDLTAVSDLFTAEEFVHIYESPTTYKEDALLFIANTSNDLQSKQIAIYSMQGLSDSLYIDFCGSIADLFLQDVITEDLVQTAIFYSLNKKYQIIRNYKDDEVIKLVNKVKEHTGNENLRKRLNNLLDGNAWSKLAEFLENNN